MESSGEEMLVEGGGKFRPMAPRRLAGKSVGYHWWCDGRDRSTTSGQTCQVTVPRRSRIVRWSIGPQSDMALRCRGTVVWMQGRRRSRRSSAVPYDWLTG